MVFARGVTTEDLNSWPPFTAALADASIFESFNSFCAAFALLLSLFFGFGIIYSYLILNYPTAADNFISIIKYGRLSGGYCTLRFVEYDPCVIIRQRMDRCWSGFVSITNLNIGPDRFRRFIKCDPIDALRDKFERIEFTLFADDDLIL